MFYTEEVKWHFRQLLPLVYVSEYEESGKRMVTVWRMWFGRSFSIRTWEVVQQE